MHLLSDSIRLRKTHRVTRKFWNWSSRYCTSCPPPPSCLDPIPPVWILFLLSGYQWLSCRDLVPLVRILFVLSRSCPSCLDHIPKAWILSLLPGSSVSCRSCQSFLNFYCHLRLNPVRVLHDPILFAWILSLPPPGGMSLPSGSCLRGLNTVRPQGSLPITMALSPARILSLLSAFCSRRSAWILVTSAWILSLLPGSCPSRLDSVPHVWDPVPPV